MRQGWNRNSHQSRAGRKYLYRLSRTPYGSDLSALADHTRASVRTSGTSLDQDEKKVQEFKKFKSTNFVKIGQYFDNKVKRAIRSHRQQCDLNAFGIRSKYQISKKLESI